MKPELRSSNPRVSIQQPSRLHAYILVDGKICCTVTNMDLYEPLLEAVEKWAEIPSCANRTPSVQTQAISEEK